MNLSQKSVFSLSSLVKSSKIKKKMEKLDRDTKRDIKIKGKTLVISFQMIQC